MNHCSVHTFPIIDKHIRKRIVNKAVETLKHHKDKFEKIVVTGYSGSIIGGIVANRLNKDIVIVRKENERRASMFDVEHTEYMYNNTRIGNCVFIDDFIFSGKTFRRIVDLVGEDNLYATYLYMIQDGLDVENIRRKINKICNKMELIIPDKYFNGRIYK